MTYNDANEMYSDIEAARAAQFSRFMNDKDPACGTTGCEKHDGECRNDWEGMR